VRPMIDFANVANGEDHPTDDGGMKMKNGRTLYPDSAKIRLLVKEDSGRRGTYSHESFEIARRSQDIGAYRESGRHAGRPPLIGGYGLRRPFRQGGARMNALTTAEAASIRRRLRSPARRKPPDRRRARGRRHKPLTSLVHQAQSHLKCGSSIKRG
jgi:hypothetical protein